MKCQGWFIGWSRLSNRFIEVQFFRRCQHPFIEGKSTENSKIRVSQKQRMSCTIQLTKNIICFWGWILKIELWIFCVLFKVTHQVGSLCEGCCGFLLWAQQPQNWTRVDVSPPIHIDEKIFLLLLMVVALVRYLEYEIIGLIGEELFAATTTTKNPNARSKSIGIEYRDIWWWDDELSYWLIQQLPLHYHDVLLFIIFRKPYLASI